MSLIVRWHGVLVSWCGGVWNITRKLYPFGLAPTLLLGMIGVSTAMRCDPFAEMGTRPPATTRKDGHHDQPERTAQDQGKGAEAA